MDIWMDGWIDGWVDGWTGALDRVGKIDERYNAQRRVEL